MDDDSAGNSYYSSYSSNNSVNWTENLLAEWAATVNTVQAQLGRLFAVALFFFGTIGNAMLCYACTQAKVRQRSYSYFLRALAVVDTVNLLISLLAEFLRGDPTMLNSDTSCKVWEYVRQVCRTMSWWTMASLSCERFLILYFPFRGRMFCQAQQVVIVIVILFVCALGLQVHLILEIAYFEVFGCTARYNPIGPFAELDVFVYKAFGYFVPNMIIVVFNCFVLRKVDSVCVSVKCTDSRPSELQYRFQRRRSKVTVMILVITFASVCAAVPSQLAMFLMYLAGEQLINLDFVLLQSYVPLLEAMLMIGYSCNFYAYVLFSKFRKQLRQLLGSVFAKVRCFDWSDVKRCKSCQRTVQGIPVQIEYDIEQQQLEWNREMLNYQYKLWLLTTNRPLLALST